MAARIPREVLAAEKRLPALAAALELPIERLSGQPAFVAAGLGRRGWTLYRGFRHALSGPTPTIAAAVDLRALLDVTILTRWIEDDPQLRIRLWFAEDDRHRLNGEKAIKEFSKRRGQPPPPPPDDDPAEVRAEIDAVRQEGRAAGVALPKEGRVLPDLERMAHAVDHLWELYHIAYRILSPIVHAGGRSFTGDRIVRRQDGLRYLELGVPFDEASLRALAVPAICMLLASVSRQAGLGIETECDEMRMSVILPPAPEQRSSSVRERRLTSRPRASDSPQGTYHR
jgi:hypothetical protein